VELLPYSPDDDNPVITLNTQDFFFFFGLRFEYLATFS